jgi:predicted anti-sigma-YlaC factor YlaD
MMRTPRTFDPWVARIGRIAAVGALALLAGGCSVKQFAIKQLGTALASSSGGAFAAEEDVEFAGQAVPFSLKLIESLLHEQPDNGDLLLAAASGFTQYAYVWVQQPGDFAEAENFARAQHQRDRARGFYLRAHRYARRALEAKHGGLGAALERDPVAALAAMQKGDVPLLYWAAMSLGGALSLGKTDPELIALRPQLEALIDRAAALDPDWGEGSLQELLMNYETSRGGGTGSEGLRRARAYFERAVALSAGKRASPLVGFAEGISVQEQKKKEFIDLLNRALAIDLQAAPDNRLANAVMQERARWLLGRVDELFLE